MTDKVPSLYELALQQCVRYAALISNIGELPYSTAKPFLAKLNPDQLAEIEARSPHIVAQSDELWRDLIAREFKDRRLPAGKFRQTFYQYICDKEAQLVAARERLKINQEQYNKNKRASSVVALSEEDLPVMQRGAPQPGFRSRTMQSVAKRAQANAHLRKQPSTNAALSKGYASSLGPRKPLVRRELSASPPLGLRSSQQSPGASPPGASPPSSDTLNSPPMSPMASISPGTPMSPGASPHQLARPANIGGQPPAKRRRVPSIFMPKR